MKNENKLEIICTIAIIIVLIFGIFVISNNTQRVRIPERTITIFDIQTGHVIYAQNGIFEYEIDDSELVISYMYNNLKIENRVFLADNIGYVVEIVPDEIPYELEVAEMQAD